MKKIIKKKKPKILSDLSENSTGVLIYNLDDHDQRRDFEAAFKGPSLKLKVDTIYDDIFRPHMRYTVSVLNPHRKPSKTESLVLEKIWEKISEHFNE